MQADTSRIPESGYLEARTAHPCFPQPPDSAVKVWRYMSLPKLISLLTSKSLHMTRLDHMADPYEGSTTRRTAAGIDRFMKTLGAERGYHEISEFVRKAREATYVSCWHANEHESEAMWRLYGGQGGGVAVQTTYKRLVESLRDHYDTYVGMVSYIDYETASFPDANAYYPVMHKRMSFAHEREVRLVWYWGSPPEPDKAPAHLSIAWDPSVHCECIHVDPYAPEYYFDAVKAMIGAIRPDMLARLQWSQMKADPYF